MQAHEIEHHLSELGAALASQGISKPIRLLLIGGAYVMLLANAPRTTDDIDICWLEEGEDFHTARLALRDAVQAIADKYALPPHWFNYLTQMLICGNRLYQNKYELNEWLQEARTKGMSDPS